MPGQIQFHVALLKMEHNYFVNLQFDSIVEAIQTLQLAARNDGKEPTHVILSSEYGLRLNFEITGRALDQLHEFNGMQIVVVHLPAPLLVLGYGPKLNAPDLSSTLPEKKEKMKLSVLISQVQELLKEHGDLPVRMAVVEPEDDSSNCAPVQGFATMMDEQDRPVHVLICDSATLDAFTCSDDGSET